MAKYATLKAAIDEIITTNGNYKISGEDVRNTLKAIIDSLGADYQLVGIATPATDPGTPDQNVAYLAGPGTYPNFGSTTIKPYQIGLFKYNGTWNYSTVDIVGFYININEIANHPAAYANAATALADVPTLYRRKGVKCVYYDDDSQLWIEMLCYDDAGGSTWWTDVTNNWAIEGPIETKIMTPTGGQQLNIAGEKRGNLDDVLNVNVWNEQITEYDTKTYARIAVPSNKRKLGLIITYLLSDGWYMDQFIGNNINNWSDAQNWKPIGPVIVIQNTQTGAEELKIGNEVIANLLSFKQFGYVAMTDADNPASSVNKIIARSGYIKVENSIFIVRLYPTNTADALTLNINDTGAMPLYYNGKRANSKNCWKEDELALLFNNGSAYYIYSLTDVQRKQILAQFGFTSNFEYNKFFKQLYLNGLNTNEKYYIQRITKNEGGSYGFVIAKYGALSTELALGYLSATDEKVSLVKIIECNSSGISGYAIVDWSVIPFGSISLYYSTEIHNFLVSDMRFSPTIYAMIGLESLSNNVDTAIQETQNELESDINAMGERLSQSNDVYMLAENIKDNRPYFLNENYNGETTDEDTSYLDEKLRNIPDGKHFIFSTDSHIDYYNVGLSQKTTEIMDYVKSRLNAGFVIFGGDCVGQAGAVYSYQAAKILSVFTNDKMNAFGQDFLWCQGNHDANANLNRENLIPSTEIFKRTTGMMARYKKIVFDNDGIELINSLSATDEQKAAMIAWWKLHYYLDDIKNQIRYIVIETGDGSDGLATLLSGTAWNGYLALNGYITFIGNALLNCPDNWDVVVVMHQMTTQITDGVATFLLRSYYDFYAMLSAFKNKTSVTVYRVGDGEYGNKPFFKSIVESRIGSAGATFNFGNRTGGRIFCISGHFHFDDAWIIQNPNTASVWNYQGKEYGQWDEILPNAILHIQLDRACLYDKGTIVSRWPHAVTYPNNGTGTGEVQRVGTKDEVLFDIITITNDNKIICTRIGGGNDRIFNIP